MREVPFGQTPARLKISSQALRLLDQREDVLVDLLLVCQLGLGERLLCHRLAALEELCLGGVWAFGGGLCKVCVIDCC